MNEVGLHAGVGDVDVKQLVPDGRVSAAVAAAAAAVGLDAAVVNWRS